MLLAVHKAYTKTQYIKYIKQMVCQKHRETEKFHFVCVFVSWWGGEWINAMQGVSFAFTNVRYKFSVFNFKSIKKWKNDSYENLFSALYFFTLFMRVVEELEKIVNNKIVWFITYFSPLISFLSIFSCYTLFSLLLLMLLFVGLKLRHTFVKYTKKSKER
jgi:hypothetical protein